MSYLINPRLAYYPSWLQSQPDPVMEAKQKEVALAKQALAQQQQALEGKQQALEVDQKALSEFEAKLEKRKFAQLQSELDARLAGLEREEELAQTEERLNEKHARISEQGAFVRKAAVDQEAEKMRLQAREKRLDERERKLQRREQAVERAHATFESETARINRSKKEVVDLSQKGIETLQAFESKCEKLVQLCKTRKLSELIPTDPITTEALEFPVVDENGHSYELPELLHWLETKKSSPVTNNAYQNADFHPQNYALREVIEKFAQLDEENQLQAATLEEEVKRFQSALKGLKKEMVRVEQPFKRSREEVPLYDMPEIGLKTM